MVPRNIVVVYSGRSSSCSSIVPGSTIEVVVIVVLIVVILIVAVVLIPVICYDTALNEVESKQHT